MNRTDFVTRKGPAMPGHDALFSLLLSQPPYRLAQAMTRIYRRCPREMECVFPDLSPAIAEVVSDFFLLRSYDAARLMFTELVAEFDLCRDP